MNTATSNGGMEIAYDKQGSSLVVVLVAKAIGRCVNGFNNARTVELTLSSHEAQFSDQSHIH
jgi:hypothetical protein